ncbi:hypothetical protein ZWY2020_014270 [Hordeum vulgare]|nr:hypothetical protein ZWY2020_014270 [Hordeum vulgare]
MYATTSAWLDRETRSEVTTMSANKLALILVVGLLINLVARTAGDDGHQFVYSGFAGSSFLLDGAASVTGSGLLELTNGTLRLKGHAIYPTPLRLRGRSFSSSFVFGILSAYPDVSANGIALFVAPTTNLSGAMAAQYIGLLNSSNNGNATNHVFAVELDTMQNNEFRDLSDNHVGIDVNSLVSVNSTDAGYYPDDGNGEFRNLTLISHEAMQVWVDYEGGTGRINVTLAPLNLKTGSRPARPLLGGARPLGGDPRHGVHRILVLHGPGQLAALHPRMELRRGRPRARHRRRQAAEAAPRFPKAKVQGHGGHPADSHRRAGPSNGDGPGSPKKKAAEGSRTEPAGVGGFGKVYRGALPASKCQIAVKRVSHSSKQGMKEFVAEIVSIGRMQHPNLVQLLGYCRRKGELLLVYEYMSNGSLDKYLHPQPQDGDKQNGATLNWAHRLGIIKGIASGLIYLHEEWEKVVVHRDIKASNVLLDAGMNGRLGDFGLAMLYDHTADPETSHVVGTIGYLAPEIGRTSKATILTDVFAFGIFVLEVICGKKPIMQDSKDDQLMLADWVVGHWSRGSLVEAVDTRLQGEYDDDEACVVLKVGLLCSHPFPEARPAMRQVLQYLNGDMPVPELVPAHLSLQMLAFMQNEGFDSYIMSYPSSVESVNSFTSLVQQR